MTILESLRKTTESIKSWVENKFVKKDEITADDFGVYVQEFEPMDAVTGDIWIDTANDPSVMIDISMDLITTDDIDEICGAEIYPSSEVKF